MHVRPLAAHLGTRGNVRGAELCWVPRCEIVAEWACVCVTFAGGSIESLACRGGKCRWHLRLALQCNRWRGTGHPGMALPWWLVPTTAVRHCPTHFSDPRMLWHSLKGRALRRGGSASSVTSNSGSVGAGTPTAASGIRFSRSKPRSTTGSANS